MKIRIYIRGGALLRLLAVRNQTQTSFAGQIGTSVWYLNKLINERVRVGPEMQKRIRKAAGRGISFDDIFRIEEPTGTSWA